ncbi:MAG: bifunctional alpha/beta hydrolase/OsmC family protein [Bacteroidota bacterium]
MRSKKLSFSNRSGFTLSARLELPIDQQPKAYALFAHCFTCSKDLRAVRTISRALTQEGIAVMSFDFTGLGQSEGEFADTNFSSNVSDLVDAAEFLNEQYGPAQLLIGHSLGGAAVLMAASLIEEVQAVVTVGAPAEPVHVTRQFEQAKPQLEQEGIAEVSIAGRPFTVKKQFLEDLASQTLENILPTLKKALLILHSPHDLLVGIDNAAKIYQAAYHPKSFISLDGADHLLTHREDAHYVAQIISSWGRRYISFPEASKDTLSTDRQVMVRTGAEGYTSQVLAGSHHLISDEPASVGGDDLGPSPYQFLLTAIGTCTSMTLRMYADRKGWDLQEVDVHLSHAKAHKQDCEACENPRSKIDVIDREIELKGNLTLQQRDRLLEIADRCPVHRTLHNEIQVHTKLKE